MPAARLQFTYELPDGRCLQSLLSTVMISACTSIERLQHRLSSNLKLQCRLTWMLALVWRLPGSGCQVCFLPGIGCCSLPCYIDVLQQVGWLCNVDVQAILLQRMTSA